MTCSRCFDNHFAHNNLTMLRETESESTLSRGRSKYTSAQNDEWLVSKIITKHWYKTKNTCVYTDLLRRALLSVIMVQGSFKIIFQYDLFCANVCIFLVNYMKFLGLYSNVQAIFSESYHQNISSHRLIALQLE